LTESLLIEVRDHHQAHILLGLEHIRVRGKTSNIIHYEGISTITTLERNLSDRLLYIAGLPIKVNHD